MANDDETKDRSAPLRRHAEESYRTELELLAARDDAERPEGWRLSPRSVLLYIVGGTLPDGTLIVPKYIGERRLVEIAIATLLTERALLLLGPPGVAKSWLSEHLSAAISGDSTLLVQGTAGIGEDALRYGWNYASLIAHGPSREAIVPSPVMRGMERGAIVRIEELTRIPSEVQDALITPLSEKAMPIPELATELRAERGFNIIATANSRDRGVNALSSALRRRFNTVRMPLPATLAEEVAIVTTRLEIEQSTLPLTVPPPPREEIERVVRIFRELRAGRTEEGHHRLKQPSSTLSTAEAIAVIEEGISLASAFGDGSLRPADLAAGIVEAVVREEGDLIAWREYLETVLRGRPGWEALYDALRSAAP